MAGTATPIYPQTVKNYAAQILPADTTTKKTLCAGAANGTVLNSLNIASTDTASRDVQLWLNTGSVDQLLTTIQVPANSGNTNALPSIDVLRNSQFPGLSYDANGNRVIYVASGWTLKVAVLTTVTAAKEVDVTATSAGDYN